MDCSGTRLKKKTIHLDILHEIILVSLWTFHWALIFVQKVGLVFCLTRCVFVYYFYLSNAGFFCWYLTSVNSCIIFNYRAIMKYHTMKMDEINKIIRDLWRNTYKGNGWIFLFQSLPLLNSMFFLMECILRFKHFILKDRHFLFTTATKNA